MLRPIISHDYHLFLVKAGNRLFEQGSIRKIYSHTSYPFQSDIILQHNSFCLSVKLEVVAIANVQVGTQPQANVVGCGTLKYYEIMMMRNGAQTGVMTVSGWELLRNIQTPIPAPMMSERMLVMTTV